MARRWTVHRDHTVSLEGAKIGRVRQEGDGKWVGLVGSKVVTGRSRKMKSAGAALVKHVRDSGAAPAPKPSKRRRSSSKRKLREASAQVAATEDPFERAVGRWMVAQARGGDEEAIRATARRIKATEDRDKLQGIQQMLYSMDAASIGGDIGPLRKAVDKKLRGRRASRGRRAHRDPNLITWTEAGNRLVFVKGLDPSQARPGKPPVLIATVYWDIGHDDVEIAEVIWDGKRLEILGDESKYPREPGRSDPEETVEDTILEVVRDNYMED